MKRYCLFAGCIYYPSGGWGDFVCGKNNLAEFNDYSIIEFGEEKCYVSVVDGNLHIRVPELRWAHIVDTETGNMVRSFGHKTQKIQTHTA